jgi:hypothetical protein
MRERGMRMINMTIRKKGKGGFTTGHHAMARELEGCNRE